MTDPIICSQAKCTNPGAFRYTWPGLDEAHICEACAPKLTAVASAIGMYVQMIPVTSEKKLCRECSECEGNHHFLDDCTDDEGEPVDPYWVCKHCDLKVACCEECDGPMFDMAPSPMCTPTTCGNCDE